MIVKYLGTGAAEGIPAVFCHCDICKYARKYKNRNIRTRAQVLIDNKILIDFGPDTYLHSLQYDIDLADIYECLITHSHNDHLYLDDLKTRRSPIANLAQGTPVLNVYGGMGVEKILNPTGDGSVVEDKSVCFHKVKPFEQFKISNDYLITAIPAMHGAHEPFVYIIEHNSKKFLYAHDTDYFEEAVWKYLKDNNIYFNAVSLDCTEGKRHIDYRGHMNFERMQTVCERMRSDGLINQNTKIVANHFSHNGLTTYDEAKEIGDLLEYIIAYDGMNLYV